MNEELTISKFTNCEYCGEEFEAGLFSAVKHMEGCKKYLEAVEKARIEHRKMYPMGLLMVGRKMFEKIKKEWNL